MRARVANQVKLSRIKSGTANLGAEAVLAGVACAGIVHGDPGCRLQAGAQHLAVLGKEVPLTVNQQAHHPGLRSGQALTLRDADPDGAQLRCQSLHRLLQ
jgi:hypothetical protein